MKIKFAILIVAIVFLLPISVYSQSTSPDCLSQADTSKLCNPIRYSMDDFGVFMFKFITIFTSFFALTALIMVVYSGFRMMISQGESESLVVAKNAFTWSLYGLILSIFAFVIIYALAEFIGAKDLNPESYVGNNLVRNPLTDTTFLALLTRLLTGFLSVSGIIAIFMIIIGGFRYITSRGNEEQAESGKNTLQWSILGLITILLAYVLVRATLTFFGA